MAESEATVEGTRVWLIGATPDDLTPATVEQNDGVEVIFKTDYGEVHRLWKNEVNDSLVKLMDGVMSEGVEDMAKMSELNQASILCNLNTRYQTQDIYTYIGSILISVNPYKRIESLYSDTKLESYRNKDLGQEPPHVYAISNECYTCMWKREENQCVLISGESGAGKTETTKVMLKYLSKVSQYAGGGNENSSARSIEQSIIESGPLLEALGNAKTVYNNNSSRFGKFIQLLFNETGQIKGARITDYLLEKHRVVRQNPGERNYHIFYQLCRGISQEERDKLCIGNLEDYHYLNQSGCNSDPSLNDVEDWNNLDNSLKTIGFKDGQRDDMRHVLAGILQLGNVSFINAGGAQVVDSEVVEKTSKLLGIDCERLEAVLKERTIKLRGEYITSPQSIDQACDSRDSLAMALYSYLFKWVISKINHKIKGPDDFHFIGILDIFGFENFKVNRFEQFCINFANEKLQEFFNRHIFSLEQIEYSREGIDWCEVEWADNSECLDLVEKNLGLISLINEESRFPKGTDNSLLQKLHKQHAKNAFYVKPRVTGDKFGIKHYAGEVFYSITGFLEKNRDTFRDDLLGLLKDSSCDLIYDMFEKVRGTSENTGKGRSKQAITASGHFKKSLHSLMERLSSANPFFVRCVKPNILKVPDNFNSEVVLNQLRYSGMLETVRVRKAGFPVRRLYQDFLDRYWMIGHLSTGEPQEKSKNILQQVDPEATLWRLGNTKAFVKEIMEQKLEKVRHEKVNKAALIVQSVVRAYSARKYFVKLRATSVHCQRFIRGCLARIQYKRSYKALRTIQRYERGRQARKIYRVLLEERRKFLQRRLEAIIVIQKHIRGYSARKMFKILLEKHRQLKALKEQMERDRKAKEEQARLERERIAKEEQEQKEKEEKKEKERLEREEEEKQKELELPSDLPPPPDLPVMDFEETEEEIAPPTDEQLNEPRFSITSQVSAIADLDAVLEQADIDSAYSTVNKNTDLSEPAINEEERLEMERIFQLEREISLMHRRSEALASVASENRKSRMYSEDEMPLDFENDLNLEHADKNRPMDILQDLGFEDFEKEFEEAVNTPEKIPEPIAEWNEEEEEELEEKIEVLENDEEFIPMDVDDESYYTDSSFDDDDDLSDVTEGLVDPQEKLSPAVYFCSYLDMKSGLINQWKRRWCALSNSTFMFFRSKQDGLKSGWLQRKSESGKTGTLRGTLPRKSWQKRWFILRTHELIYYDSDEEGSKVRGKIELNKITDVSDATEKENGIDIILQNGKVHHLSAETTEETNEWYSILMKMLSSSEKERENMESEFANPKNALGTLEGQSITEVSAVAISGKQNTFTIQTSQRAYSLACDSNEEMHHWITLLRESRNSTSGDSQMLDSSIQQGWLLKTNYSRQRVSFQRRWFVLKSNAIEYFKQSNRNAGKVGSMGLNSLCVVTSPEFRNSNLWEIVIYGRKHNLVLSTEVEEDANLWSSEIQAMIDGQPLIVTKTRILMDKIKALSGNEKEIDFLYKRNPILRQTTQHLRSPLTSLPYEQVMSVEEHYTIRDQALKVFGILLDMEENIYGSATEEAFDLQTVLRLCHDSKVFQDEVYLQLIKQTAVYTTQLTSDEQMCEQQHVTTSLHYWHLIACMCCAYNPSRPILTYLRLHLKRVQERYPDTPGAAYAHFAESSLSQQTSRRREMVPSIQEIEAILELRDLVTVINCYGGATCEIMINSFTTSGKVVQKLQRGMQLEGNRNTFALFEHKGDSEKALEPTAYLADTISKFELLNSDLRMQPDYAGKESDWAFYFKLYCVFDPLECTEDTIDYHFVFEDVHEQMIQGLYPSSEDVLRDLAALRLQFVVGNYQKINWKTDLNKYYPVEKVRAAYELNNGHDMERRSGSFSGGILTEPTPPKKKTGSSLFNTFRKRGMKKIKEDEDDTEMKETLFQEEIGDVTSNVAERWRRLKGMPQEQAVLEYVNLARTWPGYGSYLFKVENHESQFGTSVLTLGVAANGATVYKRGHAATVDHFSFEDIESFGAASMNIFHLRTSSRGDIYLIAEQVNEIVKLLRAYVNALYKRQR